MFLVSVFCCCVSQIKKKRKGKKVSGEKQDTNKIRTRAGETDRDRKETRKRHGKGKTRQDKTETRHEGKCMIGQDRDKTKR
jgi:hypothetical protein